jgi:phytoene synthase
MSAITPNRSHEITRKSRSNLAFALACLPRQRRNDMITLYAFCRVVDDIADSTNLTLDQKQDGLDRWQRWIEAGRVSGEMDGDPFERQLAAELSGLPQRYEIDGALMIEIIEGMRMDLQPRQYADWDELRGYCYRVASAVGLLSIEIFGYRDPACRVYAEHLGYALQITNIMRDVGVDLEHDRIYLPQQDLAMHGYTNDDLRARVHDDRFVALMETQWRRAMGFHESALAHLPEAERPNMLAAEMMAQIYQELLMNMRADGFRVFERRYSLGRTRKAVILLGHHLRAWLRMG